MHYISTKALTLLSRKRKKHYLTKYSHSLAIQLAMLLVVLVPLTACEKPSGHYFPLDADHHARFSISVTTMDGQRQEKYLTQNLPAIKNEGVTLYPRLTGDGSKLFYRYHDGWVVRHASQIFDGRLRQETPPVKILPISIEKDNLTQWQQPTTTFLLEKSGPPQDTLFKIQEPVLLNFQVIDQNTTITVPSGTYKNCLRIEASGESNADVGNYIGKTNITVKQSYWYAPNVGLVKSIRTETTTNPALNQGEFILEKIE